jgi:uncharacterized protein with PhoU and TrkA domain
MADPPRRTVKELLAESKDTSELMVDLAYAAVFYADPKLAEEVDHLEELMDVYIRELRLISILAARSRDDAEAMTDVLHLASCIEQMADAAVGIARVVTAGLGIPDALRADLLHADEVSGRVRVRAASECAGHSLRELELPTETGMWVIAVRRGTDWDFDPGPETVLGEDHVLLFRGPEEGVALIQRMAGAPAIPENVVLASDSVWNELDRAVDILVSMKNTAEVSVGLAYSALFLREPALAAEVTTLESRSDELQSELESWVLRATEDAPNPDELRGLLRLGSATEAISDAARSMIEWSDAVAISADVEPGSAADGKTLKELRFSTETGMTPLAVQRSGRWIYRPSKNFRLMPNDRVIATGNEDGEEEVEELVRAPVPAETA